MKYRIRYGGMLLGKEEKAVIKKAVDKNHWPSGEETKKMELEASHYLGMKHGILANSGSSAGLLALAALELPKGSEVVIPATTFPTIFNIIPQLGLVPVVVDCDPRTNNIDLSKLEQAFSEKTRAVIAVHAVGNPVDMPKLLELVKKCKDDIYVLEDNCDGWGGSITGQKLGSFGHINFTSFHAAHIVSMGQGGGVFTNDEELARRTRMYRDWGRQSDLTSRTNAKWPTLPADYDTRFIYEKMGWNLSPLELQAAMGRIQLKRTDKIRKLRQKNYDYFKKALSKFSQLHIPEAPEDAEPSWFSLPVSISSDDRGRLTNFLEENGIETRSMFGGNILRHPGYATVEHRVGNDLSGSDWILYHSFWISTHPTLTLKDREYVVKVFEKYFKKYG